MLFQESQNPVQLPREFNLSLLLPHLEEDNLDGHNLEGLNLEGDNLEGNNLEEDILEGLNLEGGRLERQNLEGGSLEGHNLEGDYLGLSLGETEISLEMAKLCLEDGRAIVQV